MLHNKTAIITGANKGIGREITKIFLENDATVWACVRKYNKDDFSSLDKTDKLHFVEFDLNNEDQIADAIKTITNANKVIDILVNNAATISTSIFQMTKINDIKNLFQVNFFSQLLITQLIVKKMIKSDYPSIINILSNSAIDVHPGRLAYSTSKSALMHSTKILAKEFGKLNIRVNGIAPGLTNTDMMNNNHSTDIINDVKNNSYLNKIADTHDIANTCLFLASKMSRHITGQIIRVDGGL